MASRRFGVELSCDRVAVWARGDGMLLEEPAVIRRSAPGSQRGTSFGTAALEQAGATGRHLSWPMGVDELADPEGAGELLRLLITRVVGRLLFSRHELMVGVPAGLSTAGRRVLLEAALGSGARMAHMMDLPLAAALGSGQPVGAWIPVPILLLSSRSAEAAVVCHEGLLAHRALAVPGGGASWEREPLSAELASLLAELLAELPEGVRAAARDRGWVLAGRSLELPRLARLISGSTAMAATVVADPAHCAVKGTEVALGRIEALGSHGLLYLR